VLELVKSFTEKTKYTLDYNGINKTWILSFIDYLCYDREYTNSSVESFLKCLRSVLNFYDKPMKFKLAEVMKGLRGKKIKNEVPFLTLEDLNIIKGYSGVEIYQMMDVRDLFLFCAYTGMRFNESQNINENNIVIQDGVTVLKYTTSKNGSTIEVPLNDWCRNTLLKWNNTLPKMKNDFANKGVHELLKLCGFNKPVKIVKYNGKNRVEEVKPMYDVITFHDSRKSFGCNLIQGNMDLQSVSDLMGVNIQTLIEWYSKSNQQERNKKALNILNG